MSDSTEKQLHYIAAELGFASAEELQQLVASVPLGEPNGLARFKRWQNDDGTKAGLLQEFPSLADAGA